MLSLVHEMRLGNWYSPVLIPKTVAPFFVNVFVGRLQLVKWNGTNGQKDAAKT